LYGALHVRLLFGFDAMAPCFEKLLFNEQLEHGCHTQALCRNAEPSHEPDLQTISTIPLP
jgi:hypothetical protein